MVGEYADEGVSGKATEMPQQELLLQMCRRREVDVIVIHRLDHWGRSLRQSVNTLGDLDEMGIVMVSLTEGFVSTTQCRALSVTK